jgi:hypothetical protein
MPSRPERTIGSAYPQGSRTDIRPRSRIRASSRRPERCHSRVTESPVVVALRADSEPTQPNALEPTSPLTDPTPLQLFQPLHRLRRCRRLNA